MTTVLAVSSDLVEQDGLFLVGVGAVVVVLAQLIWGAPRGLDGMRMAVGRPRERLGWALSVVGAFLLAVGSVLVAIGNWPHLWLLLATAGAIIVLTLAGWWWS